MLGAGDAAVRAPVPVGGADRAAQPGRDARRLLPPPRPLRPEPGPLLPGGQQRQQPPPAAQQRAGHPGPRNEAERQHGQEVVHRAASILLPSRRAVPSATAAASAAASTDGRIPSFTARSPWSAGPP